MKILFLYTELADYTLACLEALKAEGVQLKVIHYPVNAEAPFAFQLSDDEDFANVSRFSGYDAFAQFCQTFAPDKIVCSGWVNKWYVKFCRHNRSKSLTILTLDNHWNGSLKQQALRLIARVSLTKIFHYVWVPGQPQRKYARKLGYRDEQIISGFYSCDVSLFNDHYTRNRPQKATQFPHRFVCVARYIPAKGYHDLWSAFIRWKERTNNDWELWCTGTGEEFDSRQLHSSIRHLGFVQKNEWSSVIANTGVFVLASKFEPWGVAVHEFATSGFPLVLSEAVGASTEFLSETNGYSFPAGNCDQLMEIFEKISNTPDNILNKMGDESNRLAFKITPAKWAAQLLHLTRLD